MNRFCIDDIPYPLAIVDSQMVYVEANQSYLKEFRRDSSIIGQSHYEVFKAKTKESWPRHKRALQGETIGPEEDFVELENGRVWFRVRYSPIFGDKNSVQAVLIACENITQRKLMEQQLKDYSEKVTINHEVLETLFWILSHDLKLPINNLAYFARDLRRKIDKDLPPLFIKILNLIEDNADSLLEKFNSISKYVSLDLEEPFEPFSLMSCLNDVIMQFPIEFQLRFKIHGSEDIQLCERRLLFTTVLENIIGNIHRHAYHDALEIRIDIQKRDGLICIDIEDNGRGFSPLLLKQEVKPVSESTTRHSSGIGLSLVKRAVDKLGGKVNLSTARFSASGTWVSLKIPAMTA